MLQSVVVPEHRARALLIESRTHFLPQVQLPAAHEHELQEQDAFPQPPILMFELVVVDLVRSCLTEVFGDGLEEVVVDAPLGHRLRREEAKPEILAKYKRHLGPHYSEAKVKELVDLGNDGEKLMNMAVDEYVDLYVAKDSKFV